MTAVEEQQMVEFVALVDRMRAAQKRYFLSRDRNALVESKQFEKAVDRMIVGFRDREGEANG